MAFCGDVQVDVFSSLKGLGVDQLRNKLDSWFAPALVPQDILDELDDQELEQED